MASDLAMAKVFTFVRGKPRSSLNPLSFLCAPLFSLLTVPLYLCLQNRFVSNMGNFRLVCIKRQSEHPGHY